MYSAGMLALSLALAAVFRLRVHMIKHKINLILELFPRTLSLFHSFDSHIISLTGHTPRPLFFPRHDAQTPPTLCWSHRPSRVLPDLFLFIM